MEIIKEILFDGTEAILLLLMFSAISNHKLFIIKNKTKSITFCMLYIIANYISEIYLPMQFKILFLTIFTVLLISYITTTTFFSSLIIYFLFFTVISITEGSVILIDMFLFKQTLNQIATQSITGWIFSKTFQIIIITLIFKRSEYFSKFKLFQKEGTIISNFIIQNGVFGLLIFNINISIFNINKFDYSMIKYNVLIYIVYFAFILLGIKDLKEREKLMNILCKYTVQNGQIENMEEIISIIRKEKHDFANHINVIGGHCLLNKTDSLSKIKNYVTKITGELHESFIHLNTGNDYLDGLLSIKSNHAIKSNIKFDINIDELFDSLNVKYDELISIVSNLVDNAFEALKTRNDNKEMSINTFIKDNKFCIEVANNGDPISENLKEKIFEKGFSTKTNQGDDHGYGLFIIRELIENNNGKISVESDKEETSFLVEFDIKD